MQVEQLIYTSCLRGLGTSDGFQIQAVSPGLTGEDQAELAEVPMLRRPPDLSPRPTPQEIAAVCPTGFFGRRLASGRLAITRRIYTGLDYSERPGNSVLHSLVFDPAPPFSLIDLANWNGWCSVASDQPPVLRTLGPADFKAIPVDVCDVERAFIAAQPDRALALAGFIDALLGDLNKPGQNGLCIRAQSGALVQWVASVIKSLPFQFDAPIAFLTYADDALPKADLRASCNADLTMLEQSGIRVLEPKRGAAAASRVAQELARLLAADPAGYNRLRDFAQAFRLSIRMDDVEKLVICWQMSTGRLAPESPAAFAQLLRFITEKGQDLGVLLPRLVEGLQALGQDQVGKLRGDEVVDSLVGLCLCASENAFTAVARSLLTKMTVASIIECKPTDHLDVAIGKLTANGEQAQVRAKALQEALSDGLARRVTAQPQALKGAIKYVISRLGKSQQDPWLSQRVTAFVQDVLRESQSAELLLPLLQCVVEGTSAETVAEFCEILLKWRADKTLADVVRIEQVAENLATALGNAPTGQRAVDVRSALVERGLGDFVCHEIKSWLPLASIDNVISLLGVFDGTQSKAIPEMADPLSSLAAELEPADRLKFADWLIRRADWYEVLEDNARAAVGEVLDASLSLDPQDSVSDQRADEMLARGCKTNDGRLPRLQLRCLIDELTTRAGRQKSARQWIDDVAALDAAPELMTEFLDVLMPELLVRARSYEEFQLLLTGMNQGEAEAPSRWLRLLLAGHQEKPVPTTALTLIMIGWLWSKCTKPCALKLPSAVTQKLGKEFVPLIVSLSKRDWLLLTVDIESKKYKKINPAPIWQAERADIERRRKSAVVKMGEILVSPLRALGSIFGKFK